MRMLMCKYLKNNSLITCILWNQGYFGHFDYVMCFSCRGSQVGPTHPWWIFSGDNLARRKARWQVLKVTSGCRFTSGSRVISGRELTSGSGCTAGSECPWACWMKTYIRKWMYIRKWTCWRWRTRSYIRKLKSISQRVQEPDCTMIRNVSYFSEVFCAELI